MKNILSLDGGGIRSYFPLKILNEIEKRSCIPISELFDYFGGVSAGALVISLILTKDSDGYQKYSIENILEIFEAETKKIFYTSYYNWFTTVFGIFGSKYDSINISIMLNNYIGPATLNDLIKPVTFITYDLLDNLPYYINNTTANDLLVSDCILASTSAPTYFTPHPMKIDDKEYLFVDGGVVTNNPIQNCFLDAYNYYKIKNKNENLNLFVLSLGTGCYQPDNKCNYNPYYNGVYGWATKIVDVLFNGNSQDQNYELKMIEQFFSGNKIHRIDIPLNSPINLDDTTSFGKMKLIIDQWIADNDDLITNLTNQLIQNYNNKK
jgi:patatin-like phospholipase/acyl hydrolase